MGVIRVALVHSYYDERVPSGENLIVDAQAAALAAAGHEVKVFARRTGELHAAAGYEVGAALRVATRRGPGPEGLGAFAPDVVHVHNLFPNFGRTWAAHLEAPLVVTLHNYRTVCAQPMLVRDGQPCTACVDGSRLNGLRHRCYRDSWLRTLPLTLSQRGGPGNDPVLAAARRILVMNEMMADVLVRAGFDDRRMRVAPSFLLDAAIVESNAPSAQPTDAPFLFVGRFGREKGILPLLQRWPVGQRLLVVGGGGEDEQEVHRLASSNPDITLLGILDREQVLATMADCIGLLFPSTWFEGSPLVVVEALSQGLPIVAFEPTALATTVEGDGIGVRVATGDDLDATLERARPRLLGLRAACREHFQRVHSEAAFVARTEATYLEVAA